MLFSVAFTTELGYVVVSGKETGADKNRFFFEVKVRGSAAVFNIGQKSSNTEIHHILERFSLIPAVKIGFRSVL